MEEKCFKNTPTSSTIPEQTGLFVGGSPGNSSSGFANTFRILENQIKRKLTKHSSFLCSISEEEPSTLELELAARSRLAELCDTSNDVFKSESTISLNKHQKLDNVQNYIYHVSRSKSGVLSLKSQHLTPSSLNPIDDYGKLYFLFDSNFQS